MRLIMMQRKTAQNILATLSLLLGAAHIIFGALMFKTLTLDSFWFLSFGLAMMLTALGNYGPVNINILRLQNGLMFVFILALAALAPQPQVLLGCGLFAGLLILSVLKPKPLASP